MNSHVGPTFIFYDANICDVEHLIDNYLHMFDKKAMMNDEFLYISAIDGLLNRHLRFPRTGEEIYFMAINNSAEKLRGYRALIALVPEHWRNTKEEECIKIMMYSNFISYYDQMAFKKGVNKKQLNNP